LVAWVCLAFYGLGRDVCYIKLLTGLPCPTCGGTRALLAIINGQFLAAWSYNPVGYLYLIIILIGLPLLITDLTFKQEYLFQLSESIIKFIKMKYPKLILISVVVFNWVWNIQKGL